MGAIDPRYTADQILHAIYHDQLYLFLGASFITVGVVAAAFSLLRRRLDALLLWLALFATLYGARLWLDTNMVRLELPHTPLFRNFVVAISYLVPIPAFFFFDAAGFTGRWARISIYSAAAIFLALFAGTMVVGSRPVFDETNTALVIAGMIVLVGRSVRRRDATRDFVVIRGGLFVFAGFVIYRNLSAMFGHDQRVEQYGFAIFLGCLGYVAARQTVERDGQLVAIQQELEVARRIQLSILPSAFPASRSFRVAARYLPMTSVAGDFYDFLLGNDQQAGLLIADVSGHGVPAALIASMVKMAATSQRALVGDPAGLLSGMNAALCGNTQQQFIMAAYVHLDSQAGELRYSAAAHPPMLVLRRGVVIEVEENGLMLAAFSSATYLNAVSSLEPGDRILLYTDGIVEASNAEREEYGKGRLRELLRQCASLSHLETADKIMSTVQGWAVSQEDDLTVLVCDYAPGVA
jgi:sigma-B regulation protein RsbU (phosphoserine phosphatase)